MKAATSRLVTDFGDRFEMSATDLVAVVTNISSLRKLVDGSENRKIPAALKIYLICCNYKSQHEKCSCSLTEVISNW